MSDGKKIFDGVRNGEVVFDVRVDTSQFDKVMKDLQEQITRSITRSFGDGRVTDSIVRLTEAAKKTTEQLEFQNLTYGKLAATMEMLEDDDAEIVRRERYVVRDLRRSLRAAKEDPEPTGRRGIALGGVPK